MTVRSIHESDREIWRRLFTDYGVFYETSFDEHVLSGVWAWLFDRAHGVRCLVAVNETDAVVGFAMYREFPDTFTAGTALYLDDLYVDPSARSTGAATALLAELERIGRDSGCGSIRWNTASDNLRAQRLYNTVATKTDWVSYEKEFG